MSLQGGRGLRARFRAIRESFKPMGLDWADRTVILAKNRVRVGKTGKTKASIRRRNASLRKASVVAKGGARFIDKGTKPHEIKARRFEVMRFTVKGQALFRKKVRHPGGRAYPFLRVSGQEALKSDRKLHILIDEWVKAGRGIQD